MQREKTRTSALKPSDYESLFKFRLEFHPNTDEYSRKNGQPWIWYSFDKPDERELFPPTLSGRLREQWMMVLQRVFKYPDLYDFLKDCYPTRHVDSTSESATDETIRMWLPNRVVDRRAMMGDKYNQVVEDVMQLVGITDWQVRFSNQHKIPVGFSPRLVSRDFYGIQAFEQNPQIAYWFSTRKLRLVTVFDNRCYHADNRLGTIDASQYPEPRGVLAPPPRLNRTPDRPAGSGDDGPPRGRHHNPPRDERARESLVVGSLLRNIATAPADRTGLNPSV